jgi:hypothetical protein
MAGTGIESTWMKCIILAKRRWRDEIDLGRQVKTSSVKSVLTVEKK